MRRGPLLAVVAVGLLGGCTTAEPGIPVPAAVERERKVFDEAALENGVRTVLVGPYGVPAGDIDEVDCPADQEVKQGNRFTCAVRIGGADKVVDITVRSDDRAEYEVGTPRDR